MGLGLEELGGEGGELFPVLEDPAVPGVRVDDELAVGYAAVQVLGEGRGHHAVVVPVGDEGGVGDPGEVGGPGAPVALDGLELRAERRDGDGGVARLGALVEPADVLLAGALALRVPVEEEELLGVGAGEGGAQDVPVGGGYDLVDVLAAPGGRCR